MKEIDYLKEALGYYSKHNEYGLAEFFNLKGLAAVNIRFYHYLPILFKTILNDLGSKITYDTDVAMYARNTISQANKIKYLKIAILKAEQLEAKLEREKILDELRTLISRYKVYQQYYDGKTPAQAESRFYSDMVDFLGGEESRISLHLTSLTCRIKENRDLRNKLNAQNSTNTIKIKQCDRDITRIIHNKETIEHNGVTYNLK